MLNANEAVLAGEILKNRREDLGLEIHEIAESLKISEEYLSAIESDAFDKLPVAVYTMGYIRCYAAFVGIDADPVIQVYREHLSQPQPPTIMPIAFSEKKGPRFGYVVGLLVVLLAAFLLFPRTPKEKNARSAPKSSSVEKVPAGSQSGSNYTEKDVSQQGRADRMMVAVPDSDLSRKAEVTATGQHSLAIKADDTTWMSVTLENGRREEILLRPGQSKSWSFPGKAFLKVGNAGGVNISLDGVDLGKPGGPGQVKSITLPAPETGQ